MESIFAITLSYLIGSFPSSFLMVKIKFGKDITKIGSGNSGALNTLETTNSKATAVIVLLLDVIKGSLAVLITSIITNNSQILIRSPI